MPIHEKLGLVAKKVTDGVDGILSQEQRENRGERRWDLVLGEKGELPDPLHVTNLQAAMPRYVCTSLWTSRPTPSSRYSRTFRRTMGILTYQRARS